MPASDGQVISELLTLRHENRRLRYKASADPEQRRLARAQRTVDRTRRDAEVLLSAHFAWQETSRRHSPLGRRRHDAAVALLRLARLHDGRKVTASDPGRAMLRLTKAAETATQDPSLLWAMMPRARRPDVLRTQDGAKTG